jgi:hypothetical protein
MASEEFRHRAMNHVITHAGIAGNPLRDVTGRVERKEQRHNLTRLETPKMGYHAATAQETTQSAPLGVESPSEVSNGPDCVRAFKTVFQKCMEKSERQTRQLHIEPATYRRLRSEILFKVGENAPCILDKAFYFRTSEAAILRTV